jgi:hypothetical protein
MKAVSLGHQDEELLATPRTCTGRVPLALEREMHIPVSMRRVIFALHNFFACAKLAEWLRTISQYS